MIKAYGNYILTALVVITTSMAIIGFMHKPKEKDIQLTNNATNPNTAIKANMWDNYISLIKDEGMQVSDSINLQDTLGKSHNIKSLIGNKYTLIVRYSFIDCEMCIDTIMKKVKFHYKKRGLKDFLVLTDAYDERDFLIKSANLKFKLPLYNLSYNRLGMFIENKNFPFMFVMTPDLKVIKVFVPARELTGQIDEYLNYITSYLATVNLND